MNSHNESTLTSSQSVYRSALYGENVVKIRVFVLESEKTISPRFINIAFVRYYLCFVFDFEATNSQIREAETKSCTISRIDFLTLSLTTDDRNFASFLKVYKHWKFIRMSCYTSLFLLGCEEGIFWFVKTRDSQSSRQNWVERQLQIRFDNSLDVLPFNPLRVCNNNCFVKAFFYSLLPPHSIWNCESECSIDIVNSSEHCKHPN